MGPKDDRDSFLQITLKKILKNEKLLLAPCDKYFDVISSFDCARAYKLIGEKGQRKREYWIGSGNPRILKEYVQIICEIFSYKKYLNFSGLKINEIEIPKSDFCIKKLQEDTGFKPKMSFKETVIQLRNTTFRDI